MTDRLHGVVVTFEKDMRTDDAELLISAIRMLKNVIDVQPMVADYNTRALRERVRFEFRQKLYAALKEW